MSWLFSRALAVEYLGENFSDGEPSAQLNGNDTPQAYCAPDKMTAFSRLSRFGMTYKPLTGSRGEELLMLYLAGFHAKTLAQQEKAQELTENGQECGNTWRASFTKYDRVTHSWKTHQCSLLGDLEQFSETWPRWGLMRHGECLELQTLECNTNETESGLLPTVTKELFAHWASAKQKLKTKYRASGARIGAVFWWEMTMNHLRLGGQEDRTLNPDPSCGEILMGWPMGFTELTPLETGKFLSWQQQHGLN
jgi:hypothetical protein